MGKRVVGADKGFSAPAAFRLSGLSYRVGDYLARTGVVVPSVSPAEGKGSARRYSFRDVVALRAVRELREAGLSLQRVRRAASALRRDWPKKGDFSSARLIADGREAYLVLDQENLVALLDKPGQTVWRAVVDVGRIAREVEKAIEKEERAA